MGGRGSSYSAKATVALQNGVKGKGIHPIDIRKMKDTSLQAVEGTLRGLKRERAYFFDKNGKLLGGYQGDHSSVGIPRFAYNIKGATVTHGHPKGDANFGGTFSFADIRAMSRSKWHEFRATAGGQGEMNYIMRRKKGSRGADLIRHLDKVQPGMEKRYKANSLKYYSEAIKSGKSKPQAEHIARQKAVGELHKYFKETLPKYGFEYITRKDPYPYQR